MAQTNPDNGLALFTSLDLTGEEHIGLLAQHDYYFKNAHLASSKFNDANTYITNAPENGLPLFQYHHVEHNSDNKYVDSFNKNGSVLLYENSLPDGTAGLD